MKINKRMMSFFLACAMVLLPGCGEQRESTTKLVTTKDYTSAKILDSSEEQKETSDKTVMELHETYDYVGEAFKSQNSYTYRKVGKVYDEIIIFGLYNMDTKKEDVPCIYDMISGERKSGFAGEVYVWVSVPGDDDYACGLFNMTTLNEDIKCNMCTNVSQEWKAEDGNIYRWLKIPNGNGFGYGLFNVSTKTLEYYTSYESVEDSYVCTELDGDIKVIRLK